MMAKTLLTLLRRAGVVLSPRNGRVVYDAPEGALTPALQRALLRHRTNLIALIQSAWWPPDHPRPNLLVLCRSHGVPEVRHALQSLGCEVAERTPTWEELFVVVEALDDFASRRHAGASASEEPVAAHADYKGWPIRTENREGIHAES